MLTPKMILLLDQITRHRNENTSVEMAEKGCGMISIALQNLKNKGCELDC
jgi:hypothetical protein